MKETNGTEIQTMEEAEVLALLKEHLWVETETRRLEGKRKGDVQGRRKKRGKFDKLVGWGEAADESSAQPSTLTESSAQPSTLTGDMASWSLGVKESGARSQPEERLMLEIEKSLSEAKNPMEDNNNELKKKGKKK